MTIMCYNRNMKKIILAILFVVILFAAVLVARTLNVYTSENKDDSTENILSEITITSNPLCFAYESAATTDAPYSVSEKITLSKLTETEIEGIKQGTQAGPSMMNGYEGTLHGTISGTDAVVLFAYTIEGSAGTEQELYTVTPEVLTKHRYALQEIGNLLVPDASSEKTDIVYTKTSCE